MTPAQTQQRRDPEATRAAIMDAAEKLFLDKGFADVATSEIAEAAGVTKSLIHHHFGSKSDLWLEVKDRMFDAYCDRQLEMLEQADEPSPELLRGSLEAYYRFHQERPELARVIGWSSLEPEQIIKSRERELCTRGVEKMGIGQKKGGLRDDIDPRYLLALFWAVVEHHFVFKARHRKALQLDDKTDEQFDEEYLDAMLKIFMEGVLPR